VFSSARVLSVSDTCFPAEYKHEDDTESTHLMFLFILSLLHSTASSSNPLSRFLLPFLVPFLYILFLFFLFVIFPLLLLLLLLLPPPVLVILLKLGVYFPQ